MELPDAITPWVNSNTALGQALISMFKSVELELVGECAEPGAVKVVVFGGCAVHLYTHHRVSTDVDAEMQIFRRVFTYGPCSQKYLNNSLMSNPAG
jgi:hypothetical protein